MSAFWRWRVTSKNIIPGVALLLVSKSDTLWLRGLARIGEPSIAVILINDLQIMPL